MVGVDRRAARQNAFGISTECISRPAHAGPYRETVIGNGANAQNGRGRSPSGPTVTIIAARFASVDSPNAVAVLAPIGHICYAVTCLRGMTPCGCRRRKSAGTTAHLLCICKVVD